MSFNKFEKEVAARNAAPLRKEVVGDRGGDVTTARVEKIYELILVDTIWDNWEHLGWVTDLKDAGAKLESYVAEKIQYALDNGAKIVYVGKGRKNGKPLTTDEVEKVIKMPDDFIQEYVSTYCTCIDRPCITIEEMVEECLPNYELAGDEDGSTYEDYGEGTLCVRGFIHEWPIGVVDRLMAWEDALGAFEKFED